MTPRQFYSWQKGQRKNAEIARIAAYLICGPYMRPNTRLQKFWPLPWDDAPKLERVSPEQLKFIEDNARRLFESLERGNDSTIKR